MFTRDTALTSDIKPLKTQNVKFIALFLEKMLQAVPTECAGLIETGAYLREDDGISSP